MDLKFSILEISAFIPKFTETTNQVEDLQAKEGTLPYFAAVA